MGTAIRDGIRSTAGYRYGAGTSLYSAHKGTIEEAVLYFSVPKNVGVQLAKGLSRTPFDLQSDQPVT